ncbi:hypothetical protein EV361DRAFT_268013 [Lentinula raphanica]|nr:hypothetical protein EV361DRAFT_268013 [Lentinula raphanica]
MESNNAPEQYAIRDPILDSNLGLESLPDLRTAKEYARLCFNIIQNQLYKHSQNFHSNTSLDQDSLTDHLAVPPRVNNQLCDGFQYRTGTKPYVAHEQQSKKWTGPHRFRHDLESIVYVMVLTTFLYSNPKTKDPKAGSDENYWYDFDSRQRDSESHFFRTTKFVFLLGHSEWSPPPIQAFFSGFDLWLQRLRFCLFRGISTKNLRLAYQHRLTDKSEDDTDQDEIWPELKLKEDFDEDTLGGWVSYDKLFLIMHQFEGEQLETYSLEWQTFLRSTQKNEQV